MKSVFILLIGLSVGFYFGKSYVEESYNSPLGQAMDMYEGTLNKLVKCQDDLSYWMPSRFQESQ